MAVVKPVLVFDLDDTLIPSERIYPVALKRVGVDPAGDYRNARQAVKDALPEGHTSARSRLLYFKRWLEARAEFSSARLLELTEAYERALAAEISAFWTPERSRILTSLAASYDLCLLTNENLRTQMIKVRAFDPNGELFPRILTSEEAGVEKPHSAIFDLLERRMGPRPYTMIGDHARNDMAPALARGWKAVQTVEFLSPEEQATLGPESKCPRIEHLRDLVYILKA